MKTKVIIPKEKDDIKLKNILDITVDNLDDWTWDDWFSEHSEYDNTKRIKKQRAIIMNEKNIEEIKTHYEGLTPSERTKFVRELSDEMLKIYQVIDDNREYLEQLPTKEERIKESQRIRTEYYENERRKNQ